MGSGTKEIRSPDHVEDSVEEKGHQLGRQRGGSHARLSHGPLASRGQTHPWSTLRAAGRKGPSVRGGDLGAAGGFLPAVPARSQVLGRDRTESPARGPHPAGPQVGSGRLGWVPGPASPSAAEPRAPRPPTHPGGPPLTFCESMARD